MMKERLLGVLSIPVNGADGGLRKSEEDGLLISASMCRVEAVAEYAIELVQTRLDDGLKINTC
jgi:hypothetical protein